MTQTSLWETTPVPVRRRPPHQRHSDTSKAGADFIAPYQQTQRDRIYAHILKCGPFGSTDIETERALGIKLASVCGRRNGLVKDGYVEDNLTLPVRRNGSVAWTAVGL